ncbi:hypothetical protein ABT160_40800 [Streptomyces sp. NPDC001941]|uniref:hypothetical protein n=1 Tax=Streptomyces sp. NPDC001941 TaxID=3154659 RepID=UPI0033322A9A
MHTPETVPSVTVPSVTIRRRDLVALRALGGFGALIVAASVLLVVGGFTADTSAGESGQPAAVLGAIGLCLGAVTAGVWFLARLVLNRRGERN